MKTYYFIILFFGFVSCTKDDPIFKLENLNNNNIGCFGHAGMGFYSFYPPNSLPGLQSCLNRGADGTEMDICMTKDSVLVITHSGNDLSHNTSCTGNIKELNWNEISNCNIDSKFFKNSKLISLEDFILKLENPQKFIFTWDIKLSNFNQEYYGIFARTIIHIINKYNLNQNVFIENPFADFLLHIQIRHNSIPLFLLAEDFENGLLQVQQNNFYGLSMHTNKVTDIQVKEAHNQRVFVTIYGVQTEKENYEAVEKCPDFIQTDDINYLLKIFGKYHKGKGFLYSVTK